MRTQSELQKYRDECSGCGDWEFIKILDQLLGGDESVREEVEQACDQIETDLKRYGETD